MAPTLVTYEAAKDIIGTLPSVDPRPNAVNLRALSTDLEQKLETIPSQQSPECGYVGMVMPDEIYALRTDTPWQDWPDPGPHPQAAATTAEQGNIRALYDAEKTVYDSQQNVRRAVNDALNKAIPQAFRKPAGNQIVSKVFTVRDNPKQILADLKVKYGTCTPDEKTANDVRFAAPWNPSEPIESLFDRLEDCYVFAIQAKPPYTQEQLIDKAIMAIQRTGLYETALLEWQGFDEVNKTWQQLKLHFEEAYEIRLASGRGTAGSHGYVNLMTDAETDDDSIASIKESINNIHIANNTNYAQIKEHLAVSRAETAALRAELAAAKQEMANYAKSGTSTVTQVPTYVATPPPAYYTPPPVYQTPQPYYQQSRGRGRGRGRRGGRSNYNNGYVPPVGQYVPPSTVAPGGSTTIPPPPTAVQTHNPAFSNTTKYYNNMNMCFTCGWDVPAWHTSATCPTPGRYHQHACTRENAEAYLAAGHRVSKKAKHKTTLPTNPGPNQS